MIVVLHNVRSIHNVGSIFRTSDAAACEKIYCCGITPQPRDRFGREVTQFTKVSLGAEESVAWEHRASSLRLLDQLKKRGYTIFALEQSKQSVPYTSIRLSPDEWAHRVLVVGNEVAGLSRAVLKRADTILEIPMYGEKESLNVSVAFGIVAFHLRNF